MAISLEEVRNVAHLARLEMSDRDLVAFQDELNALLGLFCEVSASEFPSPYFSAGSAGGHLFRLGPLDHPALHRNPAVTRAGLYIVPTVIGN